MTPQRAIKIMQKRYPSCYISVSENRSESSTGTIETSCRVYAGDQKMCHAEGYGPTLEQALTACTAVHEGEGNP